MIFQICSKVLKDGGDAGVQPQEDVGNGKINCLIIDYGVGVWFLFPIVSLFVGIQCENFPGNVEGGMGTNFLLPQGIKGGRGWERCVPLSPRRTQGKLSPISSWIADADTDVILVNCGLF